MASATASRSSSTRRTPTKSRAQSVSDSRKALLDRGGRRLSNLFLQPDVAEALTVLEQSGGSTASIISQLILDQAQGKKKPRGLRG